MHRCDLYCMIDLHAFAFYHTLVLVTPAARALPHFCRSRSTLDGPGPAAQPTPLSAVRKSQSASQLRVGAAIVEMLAASNAAEDRLDFVASSVRDVLHVVWLP